MTAIESGFAHWPDGRVRLPYCKSFSCWIEALLAQVIEARRGIRNRKKSEELVFKRLKLLRAPGRGTPATNWRARGARRVIDNVSGDGETIYRSALIVTSIIAPATSLFPLYEAYKNLCSIPLETHPTIIEERLCLFIASDQERRFTQSSWW